MNRGDIVKFVSQNLFFEKRNLNEQYKNFSVTT